MEWPQHQPRTQEANLGSIPELIVLLLNTLSMFFPLYKKPTSSLIYSIPKALIDKKTRPSSNAQWHRILTEAMPKGTGSEENCDIEGQQCDEHRRQVNEAMLGQIQRHFDNLGHTAAHEKHEYPAQWISIARESATEQSAKEALLFYALASWAEGWRWQLTASEHHDHPAHYPPHKSPLLTRHPDAKTGRTYARTTFNWESINLQTCFLKTVISEDAIIIWAMHMNASEFPRLSDDTPNNIYII